MKHGRPGRQPEAGGQEDPPQSAFKPRSSSAQAAFNFVQRGGTRFATALSVATPQNRAGGRSLLDEVRRILRLQHYSARTEQAYVGWIRRFVSFHGKRHPRELGRPEVIAFLAMLAEQRQASASTHNQALAAILFLYEQVLHTPLAGGQRLALRNHPTRVPTVLTPREVERLLARMTGVPRLMACLLYGAGLRLLECARLRIKDVDLERRELRIRDGKGGKDRLAPLPLALVPELEQHIERVRLLHHADLRNGSGFVALPTSPSASAATRFATPSQPTCSRAATTSAPSRSCSGITT